VRTFRSILLYAVSLALLTVALRVLEYKLLIVDNARELYIGAIALLFTAIGLWAGASFRNRVRHTPLIGRDSLTTFTSNPDALQRTGITARELEVLQLVALGLSSREIADKFFVSMWRCSRELCFARKPRRREHVSEVEHPKSSYRQ